MLPLRLWPSWTDCGGCCLLGRPLERDRRAVLSTYYATTADCCCCCCIELSEARESDSLAAWLGERHSSHCSLGQLGELRLGRILLLLLMLAASLSASHSLSHTIPLLVVVLLGCVSQQAELGRFGWSCCQSSTALPAAGFHSANR